MSEHEKSRDRIVGVDTSVLISKELLRSGFEKWRVQQGYINAHDGWNAAVDWLMSSDFVKEIILRERQECAKICETKGKEFEMLGRDEKKWAAWVCKEAIQKREL